MTHLATSVTLNCRSDLLRVVHQKGTLKHHRLFYGRTGEHHQL